MMLYDHAHSIVYLQFRITHTHVSIEILPCPVQICYVHSVVVPVLVCFVWYWEVSAGGGV